MGERMGLKYNETTGEFYETPNRGGIAPNGQRSKFITTPQNKPPKVRKRKTSRSAVSKSHGLRFGWIVAPLKWLLYPFVKWWEVEKDAIDEQDWFMAVVWGIAGLVLIGLYRVFGPFVLFFLAKALDSARDIWHGILG